MNKQVLSRLKSGKIRIIGINKSDNKYSYIQRCFKDISSIDQFKGNSNDDKCYFGCVIDKDLIYIFLDSASNQIVFYNMSSRENYMLPQDDEDYEGIKNILTNSKSAVQYIEKNNNITKYYKFVWGILIFMCVYLLFLYITKKVDDGFFGTIALNIVVVMALQDCLNVYLPRFERKQYDKIINMIIGLGIIILLTGIATLFVKGTYESMGFFNNILSIVVTIGTLIIKFDKTREY